MQKSWIIIIISWVQCGGLGLSLFTGLQDEDSVWWETPQALKSCNNYNNGNNYCNNNDAGEWDVHQQARRPAVESVFEPENARQVQKND